MNWVKYGPVFASAAVFISATVGTVWYVSGSKNVKAQDLLESKAAQMERRIAFTSGTGDFTEALGFVRDCVTNFSYETNYSEIVTFSQTVGNPLPVGDGATMTFTTADYSTPQYIEFVNLGTNWGYFSHTFDLECERGLVSHVYVETIAAGFGFYEYLPAASALGVTISSYGGQLSVDYSNRPTFSVWLTVAPTNNAVVITNIASITTNILVLGRVSANPRWDEAWSNFNGTRILAVDPSQRVSQAGYHADFWWDRVFWVSGGCGSFTDGYVFAEMPMTGTEGWYTSTWAIVADDAVVANCSKIFSNVTWRPDPYPMTLVRQPFATADTRGPWPGMEWTDGLSVTNAPFSPKVLALSNLTCETSVGPEDVAGWWRDCGLGGTGYVLACEIVSNKTVLGTRKNIAQTNLWQAKAELERMTTTVCAVPLWQILSVTNIRYECWQAVTNAAWSNVEGGFAGLPPEDVWDILLASMEPSAYLVVDYTDIGSYLGLGVPFCDAEASVDLWDIEREWPVSTYHWWQSWLAGVDWKVTSFGGVTLPYPSVYAIAQGKVARVRIFALLQKRVTPMYGPSAGYSSSLFWGTPALIAGTDGYDVTLEDSWPQTNSCEFGLAGPFCTGLVPAPEPGTTEAGADVWGDYGAFPAGAYVGALVGEWSSPTSPPAFDVDGTTLAPGTFDGYAYQYWQEYIYYDAPDPMYPEYASTQYEWHRQLLNRSRVDLIGFVVVTDWKWDHMVPGAPYDPAAHGETNTPPWVTANTNSP